MYGARQGSVLFSNSYIYYLLAIVVLKERVRSKRSELFPLRVDHHIRKKGVPVVMKVNGPIAMFSSILHSRVLPPFGKREKLLLVPECLPPF